MSVSVREWFFVICHLGQQVEADLDVLGNAYFTFPRRKCSKTYHALNYAHSS
jgi:hypothetical protein